MKCQKQRKRSQKHSNHPSLQGRPTRTRLLSKKRATKRAPLRQLTVPQTRNERTRREEDEEMRSANRRAKDDYYKFELRKCELE